LHFKVITETAPEVLTPLLIAGGIAALSIVIFLLFLKFRHKIGPRHGKDRPGRRTDRAPPKKKPKKP
jgi:hypothetical protein